MRWKEFPEIVVRVASSVDRLQYGDVGDMSSLLEDTSSLLGRVRVFGLGSPLVCS